VTTTQDLTLREAQLMEAARELLQLSGTLTNSKTPSGEQLGDFHHQIHAATALAVLATGDVGNWSDFTPIVREVAAEEARG